MSFALSAKEYPALSALVIQLDNYLRKNHPDFFGPQARHPVLPAKRSKVVHDNLWGTNRYSWQELVLIDSPIIQRLRDIHQVGLAYNVYPSAHHTRFEHCLGVITIASRIFDSVADRHRGELETMAEVLAPGRHVETTIAQLRQELRVAALLHDTGHSLFSHTSERVYEKLSVLKSASTELKKIAGKERGAGEVISFCVALSESVSELLERAKPHLVGEGFSGHYSGDLDQVNIALMVIGRSKHPHLQFLGDIVSSGFDADKLDYLLRDAGAAGLPLRYDLDRYLYAVRLEKGILVDDEGELKKLYESVGAPAVERQPAGPSTKFPFYEAYRLRLPRAAMNTIEQLVICKMMLFSYLYHHPKVRAAEGALEKVLERLVTLWRDAGETDEQILERFLTMTDSELRGPNFAESQDPHVKNYSYRLVNRLIPREVYRLAGDVASHAERPLLTDFLTDLQDRAKSAELVGKLENAIGEELINLQPALGPNPQDALLTAGVWVDVPKAPKFEDVDELVIGGTNDLSGVPLMQLFPIGQWTQAYTHFRYAVRVFAFSEYWELTRTAGRAAMERIIKIHGSPFYDKVRRSRG